MSDTVEITMKIQDGREIDFTFTGVDDGFDFEYSGLSGHQDESSWVFCEAHDQDLNDIPESSISELDHEKAFMLACEAA